MGCFEFFGYMHELARKINFSVPNLNAPSIMTGEKAADHILGRAALPRANDTPFQHPEWQQIQR